MNVYSSQTNSSIPNEIKTISRYYQYRVQGEGESELAAAQGPPQCCNYLTVTNRKIVINFNDYFTLLFLLLIHTEVVTYYYYNY